MQLTVLLFAVARQKAGTPQWPLELPEGQTVADLKRVLSAECPDLAPILRTCRMAVNGEYATDDTPLQPGDELAVIPPVSGGAAPACFHRLTRP